MTDNDELVERVARYIYGTQHNSRYQLEKVKKAMRLIRPGDTYNGMMWVPVEPTDAMTFAGCNKIRNKRIDNGYAYADKVYSAMLQAAKGDE